MYGQNKYPTKLQLTKSLTKKTKLKGKAYNSTNWFTIESDSAYRNLDTLVFYNNSSYRSGKLICNFVDWNFYKKDAFWVQHVQLCKEPTTATAIKNEDFFTYDVSDKGQPMILRIFNNGKLVDTFEVLSLTRRPLNNHDSEMTDVLTLHRIKKVDSFNLTLSFGQTMNSSKRSVKILSCETGLIYKYADNKVVLEGTWHVPSDTSKIWFSKSVDKATSASFDKLFDIFSTLDKKLFYYNHCVDDGLNFKVYIQNDTSIQKIFVGNYYDKLVDSLTTLFQEQIKDFNPGFIVSIGYGKDKKSIDDMIKSQNTCDLKYPNDYKSHLLDNWCELEDKK
jgi:hypothetical protein